MRCRGKTFQFAALLFALACNGASGAAVHRAQGVGEFIFNSYFIFSRSQFFLLTVKTISLAHFRVESTNFVAISSPKN